MCGLRTLYCIPVDDNIDIENQTEEHVADQEPIVDGNFHLLVDLHVCVHYLANRDPALSHECACFVRNVETEAVKTADADMECKAIDTSAEGNNRNTIRVCVCV